MTRRPPLLQIPGRSPCLLVHAEDVPKLHFYLRGMQIHFRTTPQPSGITNFELPNMKPSTIQRLLNTLMRESA